MATQITTFVLSTLTTITNFTLSTKTVITDFTLSTLTEVTDFTFNFANGEVAVSGIGVWKVGTTFTIT